jgi:hypothetical protein
MNTQTWKLSRDEMILRVARAAARDHDGRDLLAVDEYEDTLDRMYYISEMRNARKRGYVKNTSRSVGSIANDAKVLGRSGVIDPKYSRDFNEIVVRVHYAGETFEAKGAAWADYAVTPDPSVNASCWQD